MGEDAGGWPGGVQSWERGSGAGRGGSARSGRAGEIGGEESDHLQGLARARALTPVPSPPSRLPPPATQRVRARRASGDATLARRAIDACRPEGLRTRQRGGPGPKGPVAEGLASLVRLRRRTRTSRSGEREGVRA